MHVVAPGRNEWLCVDGTNRLTNIMTDGDCVTGRSIVGLGYDVQGNLINANGKLHNFDYGNRLRSITSVESYRYDAQGRRVRAWTPSQGLLYSFYSQAGQLLWQRDARSAKRREYVYLNGSLVAERSRPLSGSTATITYQHTDALGTPVAKTNASRVVVQRREYEPYGKLLTPALEAGPGFTGHDTDVDTGYTYMQQRYFDPRVGRLLSVDPVTVDSAGGNFNRYWYANDNPYRFTDPDGRQSAADNFSDAYKSAAEDGRTDEFQPFVIPSVAVLGVMTAPVAYEIGMWALANPGAIVSAGNFAAEATGVTGVASGMGGAANGLGKQNSLYKSAVQQFKATDLSNAGRALTKHPEVVGATKESLRKELRSSEAINDAAHAALRSIMRSGQTTTPVLGRYGAVTQIQVPEGYGARWAADGGFIGFISP